jgi:hypothetical protein
MQHDLSTDDADALPTANGGIMSEAIELPDGSGVSIGSLPLPKDHWIYQSDNNREIPLVNLSLLEIDEAQRSVLEAELREALKYAIRGATFNGRDENFDPDALLQNFRVAVFGYYPLRDNGASAGSSEAVTPPIEIYIGPHHGVEDDFTDAPNKPLLHHPV